VPNSSAVKRAETRQCPICSEQIPVRLLEAHCDLETQRTEEIIKAVGSLEIYGDSADGLVKSPSIPPSPPLVRTLSTSEFNFPELGGQPFELRKPSRNPVPGMIIPHKTPPLERKK
jgi:hypothetical protein